MKNKKWLLPAASLILAVLALIAYTMLQEERTTLMYVQVVAAAFVPSIVPIISTITKKEFPPIVNILITVHVLLASHLGSALGFYSRFSCWDLVMHGYFGFVGATALYVLLMKWNGASLKRFGFFVLIFLGTMGCAALWEMFEFTADTLLGCDAQRVHEALALGISPVKDTMTDIMVAAFGVVAFFIGLLADKFADHRIASKLYST